MSDERAMYLVIDFFCVCEEFKDKWCTESKLHMSFLLLLFEYSKAVEIRHYTSSCYEDRCGKDHTL